MLLVIGNYMYGLHRSRLQLDMDVRLISSSSCTCTKNKMRTHENRTDKYPSLSFPHSDCHCPWNSANQKICNAKLKRRTSCYKNSVQYHSQHDMNRFIVYFYSLLWLFCMVTLSDSVENVVIEDQLAQVGHFFHYNLLSNGTPLNDSFQLKV